MMERLRKRGKKNPLLIKAGDKLLNQNEKYFLYRNATHVKMVQTEVK
jgi:hypothetical protein